MAVLIPIKMTINTPIKMYARTDKNNNAYTRLFVNNEEYDVYGYVEIDRDIIKFRQ